MKPNRTLRNLLLGGLGIILILRLLVLIPIFRAPGLVQLIEHNTYLELATSMLERGTYEGYSRDNIDLVRTPIYPLFAAGVLGVSGQNLAYLALAQVLLTMVTCGLVFLVGREIFGETAAVASAWVFALSPTSLFVALTALTETLFAVLLALSVYLLVRYWRTPDLKWAVGSAVLLGLNTLVRPIGIWLIPLWAVLILINQTEPNVRRRMQTAGAILLAGTLVLIPWQLRNYFVADQFTLTPVGEKTIRNWMIAPGLAEARGFTREQAVSEIASQDDEQAYLLEIIRTYPKPVLIAQLTGIYRTVVGFEYGTWMILLGVDRRPGREYVNAALARNLDKTVQAGQELLQGGYTAQFWIPTWALGFNLVYYFLMVSSVLVLRKKGLCVWCYVLLAAVVGYLLVVPFAAGQARFRVPPEPLMAVLAGLGVTGWAGLIQASFRRVRPAGDSQTPDKVRT